MSLLKPLTSTLSDAGSDELRSLAKAAVDRQRKHLTPEEIREWADKLSRDMVECGEVEYK
jgi:hypothetical protein